MRTVNPNLIKEQINNCYDSYDPSWHTNIGNRDIMNSFKYHLEHTAGVNLNFEVELRQGRLGYKINSVEIVDEQAFMVWMLKWA